MQANGYQSDEVRAVIVVLSLFILYFRCYRLVSLFVYFSFVIVCYFQLIEGPSYSWLGYSFLNPGLINRPMCFSQSIRR